MPPSAKASDHKGQRKRDADGVMWESRPVTHHRWFRVQTNSKTRGSKQTKTNRPVQQARPWLEDVKPRDRRQNRYLYRNFYDKNGRFDGTMRKKPRTVKLTKSKKRRYEEQEPPVQGHGVPPAQRGVSQFPEGDPPPRRGPRVAEARPPYYLTRLQTRGTGHNQAKRRKK